MNIQFGLERVLAIFGTYKLAKTKKMLKSTF